MNYIVTSEGFISPELKKLKPNKKFIYLSSEELSNSSIKISKSDKVYVPTESALQSVFEKMTDKKQKDAVIKLKDKFACRKMLQSLYPSFYFSQIPLKDLTTIKLKKNKKYVIKPKRGFFNSGVRIFTAKTDMKKLQEDISKELAEKAKYFSSTVLSSTEFVIEEYISGTEFAIDMFYSSKGQPTIMNIYKHPNSKYKAYFNLVYYSEQKFFEKYLGQFNKIFIKLNDHLKATSMPIHAEFKYVNNEFVPIEFNPMRYGGMGLADLTKYAYSFDPFFAYFNDTKPDWKAIWQTRKNKYYVWALGYNGTKANIKIQKPNHEKFKKTLGKILHYNKLNFKKMPVFANAYIEADKKKIAELLNLEFNNFFE